MKIKMLTSVVSKNFTSYTHNGVYEVSDNIAKGLIDAGYAIEAACKKQKKKTKGTKK